MSTDIFMYFGCFVLAVLLLIFLITIVIGVPLYYALKLSEEVTIRKCVVCGRAFKGHCGETLCIPCRLKADNFR